MAYLCNHICMQLVITELRLTNSVCSGRQRCFCCGYWFSSGGGGRSSRFCIVSVCVCVCVCVCECVWL